MFIGSLITLTFVGAVVVRWFFRYMKRWIVYSKLPGPPEWPLPFIGHAWKMRGDPDAFFKGFTDMVHDHMYPNKYQVIVSWFATQPVALVAGPDAAEVLLRSSKHIEKSVFYKFMESWLGTGLLTSGGSKWKERRRLLTPSFHFKILQNFLSVMNNQAKVLCGKLKPLAESSEDTNIFNHVTLCALDIICETAMGKSINAQSNSNSEYVKAIYNVSEKIQHRQKSPWLWPNFIYDRVSAGKEYHNSLRVLHGFSQSVIKSKLSEKRDDEKKPQKLAFLDLLLDVRDQGNSLGFSDIQEEVDTFMFEGHDTTSSGMSFAIHQIGSYPEVQKKIQDELDTIFGDDVNRDVTMDDLQKMTYLEMVLKETLRVLPPVPFISRVTTEDCKIDGYFLPRDTTVILMLYNINRHPDHWEEPDKFDPERFRLDNLEKAHPFAHLPFSAGPRNCIGQKFAMMEEKIVLSHVLRHYHVTSRDSVEDMFLMGDLILRPKAGVHISLSKRR